MTEVEICLILSRVLKDCKMGVCEDTDADWLGRRAWFGCK